MEKNKLYKTISSVSISLIFVIAAIFVCLILGTFKLNSGFVMVLGVLVILAFAGLFALPWLKYLEEKKYKTLSIVFLVFICVCALMFIISFISLVNLSVNDGDMPDFLFVFIKVSLIIATQLLTASTIVDTILKYKKSMILFQTITYVSNLFVDFWFTCLFVGLYTTNSSLKFNETINSFLFTKLMWTILAIALVYVMISGTVIKRIEKRKLSDVANANGYTTSRTDNPDVNTKRPQTPEEKLTKLQFLLDRNLITKEDFEEKKKEILKDL